MRTLGVRPWLSVIGVLVMTMALAVSQTAAAQSGGTKQIVNGQTVTWSAEWSLDPEIGYVDQELELVALNRAQSILGYGATSFAVPGNQLRDVLIEGFTSEAVLHQVDRGNYDNISYSLDITRGTGFTLALFTLVIERPTTTTIAILIDDATQFQPAMQAAQAGVTIDGTPIFNGVDGAVMQQHLTNATGEAPGSTTTPEAPQVTPAPPQPTPETVAPTPTPTAPAPDTADGTGSLLGDLNSGLGGQQSAPQTGGGEQAPATTGSPANSVVLEQSGVEIRYSDDWSINIEESSRIQFGSSGEVRAIVAFLDLPGLGVGSPAMELAEGLLSTPELVAPEIVDALDLENGRKLIVMVDRDPAGDVYMIYDITQGATATTAMLLVVNVDSIGPAVDLAQSTLQVDGEPVLVDIQEIAPAIFPSGM